MSLRAAALLVALVAAARPAGAADTLCLKDGRIFDDVDLERGEASVLIRFKNGQVTVPLADVLECIIANDPGFVPVTEEDKRKAAEGLVLFQGSWVKPKELETRLRKLLEEQRAAVAKLRETRQWRSRTIVDSKTFAFEYTVPRPIFEGYEERMEAYYAEFVKRWKIKRPRDLDKLKVRFYTDPEDFYQVTGVQRGVLAFFEFIEPPYRLQFYYDRLDPLGVERDMFHEFGHYLQQLIDTGFHYPHWPGESLAEYYSTANYDPKTKKLTVEPRVLEERLVEIQADFEEGERVGLEALIKGGNDGNYHDYTWGWSLVHFLMSKPDTARKFEDFYIGLARSPDVKRESASYLKNFTSKYVSGDELLSFFKKEMDLKKEADVRTLETAWHRYVQEDIKVTSSRGLERAARMAQRSGRQQRAKRLYEEAIAAGDAGALTHHRYAELLDDLDEKSGAREHWKRAVELDPLVSDYYIPWGKALLKDPATKEEGKRLLKLAQEIEPENLYLEHNLEKLLAK